MKLLQRLGIQRANDQESVEARLPEGGRKFVEADGSISLCEALARVRGGSIDTDTGISLYNEARSQHPLPEKIVAWIFPPNW